MFVIKEHVFHIFRGVETAFFPSLKKAVFNNELLLGSKYEGLFG